MLEDYTGMEAIGIREHLPHARRIIDKVRKAEGRENGLLKRTKYLCLRNEAALSDLHLETKLDSSRHHHLTITHHKQRIT